MLTLTVSGFSEVRGWLSRPVVGRDDSPWQRGASQCGGVSVCLQGGSGLWRPGDSGFRNEGNTTENCVIQPFRDTEDTQGHCLYIHCTTFLLQNSFIIIYYTFYYNILSLIFVSTDRF